MTRGNPRSGQRRMPDRSAEVEREAHKEKRATTNATGEIKESAAERIVAEAREAARTTGTGHRKAAKRPPEPAA